MGRYLLLVHGDEGAEDDADEDARSTMLAEYGALAARMRESGHLVEADELAPSHEASIVRVREGITDVVDGPFAETKEQLGGYYLLEVDHLDDAIEAAARCPGAETGTIELRPVADVGEAPGE